MSCYTTNVFHNVSGIGDNYLINQLEDNLKSFLDYGFLNIGAFVNVNIPTSGLYGGVFSDLKSTSQPGYKDNQIWQSFKKDWIYETGISYNSYSPNIFSGVVVNNTFYPAPTGSGSIKYSVNYPLGQIIFDKPISSNSSVKANYSYRWCQVYKSSSDNSWKELQELTYQPSPEINYKNSGTYNIGSNHRIQMPAIVVEPVARSYSQPWQLGATNFMIDQDILLHVFSENKIDNNKIVDILRLQKDKNIILYDTNKLVNSGVYAVNYDGSLNSLRIPYHLVLENYKWKLCFLKEVGVIDMQSQNKNLFWSLVRLTTQVII
jgi:hypothetical protein